MLDIRQLRQDPQGVEQKLKTKDPTISLSSLLSLDEELRAIKTKGETLKANRNALSQEIGKRKREGQATDDLMKQVDAQADALKNLDQQQVRLEKSFQEALAVLPNLPMDDIKISPEPKDNVTLKEVGTKPEFAFPFKNHVELNEKLHLFDFQRSAKVSGSGWPAYRGLGARLEWALINYMLNTQIKNGFEMWMPPLVVRPEVVYGSGQLPKFANQQFHIKDDDFDLYMIPTAEVPLNGLHLDEILPEEALPTLYTAYTPCFRREAGAAGSQERGLIRMHQFNKVEMFVFCKPEEAGAMFDKMMASAEEILQGLGLHYRNMLLVTGDMSYASARTVDIEVWLPGQNRYYEVSSVSNCTDFQARRSNIRFRNKEGKLEFVYTLNGSGLATSRLMVALLENNQQADGSVKIPAVLHPYINGISILTPS